MESSISTLPPSTAVTYVAEGAANVIYCLSNATAPAGSKPFLLRLRKALPTTSSTSSSHADFVSHVRPLLPSSIFLKQELVRLPHGLVQSANEQLREDERAGKRPQKRKGVYLEERDEHGLLVEDMRADRMQGEVLVEFKPKWLAPSPAAPKGAVRCRTCALRAKRGGTGGWCPLDLVGDDEKRLGETAKRIVADTQHLGDDEMEREKIERILKTWLRGDAEGGVLLRQLRDLQTRLDPRGVLELQRTPAEKQHGNDIENLRVAMTLRDCTLFVKLRSINTGRIEARLGDLDLKAVDGGKIEYWSGIERGLIDEGWYEGREVPGKAEASPCALASSRADLNG